jgi:hypothetical protein
MLNEEGVDIDLLHNLPHGIDRDTIADAFQKNANLLFERKGGNIAYHEILSLPANDHDRERVKAALREIGQMYLDERAPENIALGVIHSEKAHLHLHIMLSSNRLMDRKRLRLSKKDFLMVQENVSSRAAARFPELQLDNLYTPDRVHSHTRERVRLSQGQQHEHQHGKDRPKKTSRKVELSSLLHGLLAQHQDKASLDVALKRHGLAIYQRGNTLGVIDHDHKKYRLGTLGVMVHYQEWQVQSQTQRKPKVAEKETSQPEQKPQEKPKNQSQETKPNQEPPTPKDQTNTKQSGKDFEAKLKQRMFEEQLNRRIDELKQARSQGRDRDDEAER